MNPFIDSTVAVPTGEDVCFPSGPAVCPVKQRQPAAASASRRRMLGFTLCALAGSVALAATAHALDINTASLEQLRAVRGIGPKTAEFILQERQRAGPFASFDDLSDRVKGIGPKKAASLQASGLTLGTGGARESSKIGAGARP